MNVLCNLPFPSASSFTPCLVCNLLSQVWRLEYGYRIPAEEQDEVSVASLRMALGLLDELAVPATLFCTALFAERHPELIRRTAATHEIASHGLRHARLEPGAPRRSRERLAQVVGTTPPGRWQDLTGLPRALGHEPPAAFMTTLRVPATATILAVRWLERRLGARRGRVLPVPAPYLLASAGPEPCGRS